MTTKLAGLLSELCREGRLSPQQAYGLAVAADVAMEHGDDLHDKGGSYGYVGMSELLENAS